MAQIKKEEVRDAILAASFELFRDKGYNDTSLPTIARAAGISTANVYVYFGSKLEILFTLYAPWIQQRLDQLDRSLARTRSRRARLEKLLLALWRDIPRDDNGFSSNVIQALASTPRDEYNPLLRELFQGRVSSWLAEFLDMSSREAGHMAGVLLMAFDGFVINVRLAHGVGFNEEMAQMLSRILLGADETST
ncbi:TetR/AcrR family transcriptional regulator [Hydrogenophaga sp. OTU3427]|uniref:TetR/AcrR family transcriptional regulator n=1 Tax=Hydrogenophaga sp. OTU3427 TaxID=3043856 RepID=UPI00313E306C